MIEIAMAFHAYSVVGYARMIADRARLEAYAAALRQRVRPTSIVIDIGTGAGMLALLAARYGARRVFAIEPCAIVGLGEELAIRNGCADRIEFIDRLSTAVSLSERADVIVADLRGVLPLFQSSLATIIDARRRLLAPSGHFIPECDTLWVSLASVPSLLDGAWRATGSDVLGIDMSPARPFVANSLLGTQLRPEQLLVQPRPWATFDYAVVEETGVGATVTWRIDREGTVDGIVLWFEASLTDTIGFSSAPGTRDSAYGQALLPVSERLHVRNGDVVTIRLAATAAGDDYAWSWETCLARAGETPIELHQSTTLGELPRRRRSVAGRDPSYVPELNEDGSVILQVLQSILAREPLGEIAETVRGAFPNRFTTIEQALRYVTGLSTRLSV